MGESEDECKGRVMNMYRPRVLLAEDNADTAERLRKLLRAEFDVIASVEDGARS